MFFRLLIFVVLLGVLVGCDVVEPSDVSVADPVASVPESESPATTGGETVDTVADVGSRIPPGAEGLSPAMQEDLAELISETEDIRGLPFESLPTVELLNPEAFRQRVRALVDEELGEVVADEALYALLGLIPDDLDLRSAILELYGDEVAGFYDGETGSLVVATRNQEFSEMERATLVHELTHALTDQHLDFDTTNRELVDTKQFDAAAAYLTLIEGDAVNVEYDYVASLPQNRLDLYYEEIMAVDTAAWDDAPTYLRDALSFPYIQGEVFVRDLLGTGGYQAVNDAYAAGNFSTEQVIRTRDFGRDLPKQVDVVDLTVPGYNEVTTSTWGELGFRLLLNQFLGEEVVARAAEGWGGDTYRQLHDGGGEALLLLEYRGDTNRDGAELAEALAAYAADGLDTEDQGEEEGATVFRGEDNLWIQRDGARVTLIVASSPSAFDRVISVVSE
ncbi:MAG: hypothetical protein GEU79_01135 [Acidimicrobiia bacterium]|nr:hypothetical protein [Acidimicrobiia bacterium]